MKLFFIDKYSMLTFLFAGALSVVLFLSGGEGVQSVYSSFGNQVPIYSVETEEKAVSITFDTAWGCEDIPAVLDALQTANCKATFFITGDWADKFPESVKLIFDAGHEVANHGNAHEHFSSLSKQQMADSISLCDDKIRAITGQSEILFRAPYGEYNEILLNVCKETDRYIIQWSKDSLDYKGLSAEEMKKRILPKLRNGDIILFHTGTEQTASALPEILEEIKNCGYSFKTAGELILKDNFKLDHEGRQFSSM